MGARGRRKERGRRGADRWGRGVSEGGANMRENAAAGAWDRGAERERGAGWWTRTWERGAVRGDAELAVVWGLAGRDRRALHC